MNVDCEYAQSFQCEPVENVDPYCLTLQYTPYLLVGEISFIPFMPVVSLYALQAIESR